MPDGHGGWVTAQDNLGFPAGRKKTILFNLTNVFRPGTSSPRAAAHESGNLLGRDSLGKGRSRRAAQRSDSGSQCGRSALSRIFRDAYADPAARAPEVPDYNEIEGTKQRWRDLIGYYTRYGDIRELLKTIDDRYVIVNSGDELSLRFAEQPPPPRDGCATL